MARRLYVLIPTISSRANAKAKSSRPSQRADSSSKRGKRKLVPAKSSRGSKRLKSESPHPSANFGETQSVKIDEDSDESSIQRSEAPPINTSQSSFKFTIRLPSRKFSSSSEISEYDDAHPSRPGTAAAPSDSSSGNGSIRRVRLIVRPPRSPTPDLDQNDADMCASRSSSRTSDSESIQTDSLESEDSEASFITRSWFGRSAYDSPLEVGTFTKEEPTAKVAFTHKQWDTVDTVETSPRNPIAAALDRTLSLSPDVSVTDRACSFSSLSSTQSTLDLSHDFVSTESESDSELEGELMYPEFTTPPSSPKAVRVVHWFDFEKYGNMIPGC